jgi:putative membrane protein
VTVHDLPVVNASLNGLSAVFITVGWCFILNGKVRQHMICMISAVITSTIFLACYLTYRISVRYVTYFPEIGWIHTFYIGRLISHVLLAFASVPLGLPTLTPALKRRFDKHKRIARWTLPIWLYVSVTGVLVYMMLYQWFPPSKYPPLLPA